MKSITYHLLLLCDYSFPTRLHIVTIIVVSLRVIPFASSLEKPRAHILTISLVHAVEIYVYSTTVRPKNEAPSVLDWLQQTSTA